MLNKTLQIKVYNFLPVTNDEQYSTVPKDTGVIKCLISKGHFCFLSEALYPVSNHQEYLLVLHFNNEDTTKTCNIFILQIYRNYTRQISHNYG